MNIIDIFILIVLAVSIIYGLYRGFINGVLSIASLIGSTVLAFLCSGELANWLKGNKTLVDTLMYYTDAGSRIRSLDLSMLSVSQVNEGTMNEILQSANLHSAFETAFVQNVSAATNQAATVADMLSQTIVTVALSIISFLICFLIAYIVCTFLIHLISYVFELPVLRHLDSFIGGVFGLVRGWLLLVIFFALVPIVMAVVPIEQLQGVFDASRLAPLFDSQIIMKIIGG